MSFDFVRSVVQDARDSASELKSEAEEVRLRFQIAARSRDPLSQMESVLASTAQRVRAAGACSALGRT